MELIKTADSLELTLTYDEWLSIGKKAGFTTAAIKIKEKNKGKFTEYCGGEVTDECIERGLKSDDPKRVEEANFARNSRKWKKK